MSETCSTPPNRSFSAMSSGSVPRDSRSISLRRRCFRFLSCGAIFVLLAEQIHSSLPTLHSVIQEVQEVGLSQGQYGMWELSKVASTETTPQQPPQQKTMGTTPLRRPVLDQRLHSKKVVTLKEGKKKKEKSRTRPWETKPPTTIPFMNTTHDYIKRRHTCIQAIRARHKKVFKDYLVDDNGAKRDVVLVDPAYHKNVGDHMLTLGEIRLLKQAFKLPHVQQCHYRQAQNFVEPCEEVLTQGRSSGPKSGKVALWHAGGNWGDIWVTQPLRIQSIKTILENDYIFVGFPQSLFYQNETTQNNDTIAIQQNVVSGLGLPSIDALDSEEGRELSKKRVTFMWREKTSYEDALRLYPFVTNILAPDMAFELGPFAPIRTSPEKLVDITVFLREDQESTISERTRDFIESILPRKDLTFELVDWTSRNDIFNNRDYFFTDSSIQLISMGKVMVCDRLHAAILGYLTGIPFVYIDQIYGKITKTLSASLGGIDGCMDGEASRWAKASNLEEALALAAQMITER